jgi:hypothetical protein
MIKDLMEFAGAVYDSSHGSPFDRGSADSYYGRFASPHWYPKGTGRAPRIEGQAMTQDEIKAYYAGYEHNEQHGDKKSWD